VNFKMKTLPDDFENIEVLMSNFDGEVEEGAEEELKAGSTWGEYTAWNFCTAVWWDGSKFQAIIKQFHAHIDTIEADSLKEIMNKASGKYGWD